MLQELSRFMSILQEVWDLLEFLPKCQGMLETIRFKQIAESLTTDSVHCLDQLTVGLRPDRYLRGRTVLHNEIVREELLKQGIMEPDPVAGFRWTALGAEVYQALIELRLIDRASIPGVNIPNDPPAIARYLDHRNRATRMAAIEAIAASGDQALIPLLENRQRRYFWQTGREADTAVAEHLSRAIQSLRNGSYPIFHDRPSDAQSNQHPRAIDEPNLSTFELDLPKEHILSSGNTCVVKVPNTTLSLRFPPDQYHLFS